MDGRKRIALSAHDAAKPALAAWVFANESVLSGHRLTATGNTGQHLMAQTGLEVRCLRAGALGGDMELGALIAEGRVDLLVFFLDPLTRRPHDIEPARLVTVATLTQTAVALNESTADFIVRSELMVQPYRRPHGPPALPPVPQRIDVREGARAPFRPGGERSG